MDKYDLGAVKYDWHEGAVERLRKLCTNAHAEIVISSDWRRYSPLSRLKDYFRLHVLDKFVAGCTPQIPGKMRCDEITEFLKSNVDIQQFVILDDAHTSDFETNYTENFVYCRNCQFKRSLSIRFCSSYSARLRGPYWWLYTPLPFNGGADSS